MPDNDTCSTATVISALDYNITVSPAGASDDEHTDSPCGSGSSFGSLWWKWTGTAEVSQIGTYSTGGAGGSSVLTVFSGSCGALTHIACTDFELGGPELILSVSEGVDYFFMVTSLTGTLPSSYGMNLRDASAAVNDHCADAIDISSLPFSVTKSMKNATADGPTYSDAPCGSGSSFFGIWYSYTATAGVTRLAGQVSDSENRTLLTAFSGGCGAPVSLGCMNSGNAELFIDVTEGDTYLFLLTTQFEFPHTTTFSLRDASLPDSGGGATNTLCVTLSCGPILLTGPQRRWTLHRFDLKPSPAERS